MTYSKDNLELVTHELEKNDVHFILTDYSYDHPLEKLSTLVNSLIVNDFQRLISLLYRLDISEKKLQSLLHESGDIAAGKLIAKMIIERQLQKIEARKSFKKDDNIPDDEKW